MVVCGGDGSVVVVFTRFATTGWGLTAKKNGYVVCARSYDPGQLGPGLSTWRSASQSVMRMRCPRSRCIRYEERREKTFRLCRVGLSEQEKSL